MIYASLGDKDQAFAWLEKAYEARSGAFPPSYISPAYDPLRADPRFKALMQKMRLEE